MSRPSFFWVDWGSMKLVRALIFVTFGAFPALAGAQATEIYKCVDTTGRPLYTSDKRDTAGKKCALQQESKKQRSQGETYETDS